MGRRPELKSDENSEVPPLFHEISAVLHVKRLKRLMQSFVTRLGIGDMRMHAPPAHARPPRARRSRRLRASSTGGMKTATPS